MTYTRRDLGRIALATVPAIKAFGAFATINSKVAGVQLGAISYSFRSVPDAEEIIKMMVQIGLGEAELMSNHAEALAGAPMPFTYPGRRGGGPPPGGDGLPGGATAGGERFQLTPKQEAERRARLQEFNKWRSTVSMDAFKAVRKKFDDVGIDLALLCYNMNERTEDDEMEYAFTMAKGLGVKAITTSAQVTVSKRIAPFADKFKLMVGFHGHDQTNNPNTFSTPDTFATAMSYSKYHGVNLDIGHFTAANYDPIPYIKEHYARITNLHLKDRKKDHGPNTPWGQGDTPISEVLRLVSKEKYSFPANIEFEFRVPEGSDLSTEISKCLRYCKDALA